MPITRTNHPLTPRSAFTPEPPLPGFPLDIVPHPVVSPLHVVTLLRVFHGACEQGNMALANETFVTLRAAISEYALHHYDAVNEHLAATRVAMANAAPQPPEGA